jgi:hypothetical protein
VAFDDSLRKYATQATLALSLVVGITGVMMFYRLFKAEVQGMHEWLGMGFVVVAILHALRHRRGLPHMLKQTRTQVLLGAAALAAAGFIVLAPPKQGNPTRELVKLATQAPLAQLAPLVGATPEELAGRLGATPDLSLAAIAKAQGKEPMAVLAAALRKQP